jgi:RNA polymerase sigma-70 factor, ECF subfamily
LPATGVGRNRPEQTSTFRPSVTLTDSELVAQARSGHQQAHREIVARYERPIFNLIVRAVRDPSVAEDLAQDTFFKAFTHLNDFNPAFKLANWLLKIAHNTVIDYLRRRRPQTVPIEGGVIGGIASVEALIDRASDAPVRNLERAELAHALDRAMDTLRPAYRQALVLRYHEDCTYEEIAGIMELPVGTVKSYLHRARILMAARLSGRSTREGQGRGATRRPVQPGRAPLRRKE